MKGFRLFFLLTLVFFSANIAFSQSKKPTPYMRTQADLSRNYPGIVKVNVLSPLALTANFSFEKFINSNHSVQLGGYYGNFNISNDNLPSMHLPAGRYESFGLVPEFRFYMGSPGRQMLDGWFIAPFLRLNYTTIRQPTTENMAHMENHRYHRANVGTFRVGGVGGYKYLLNDRFSLEAFAGPSVRILHWYSSNGSFYRKKEFLRYPFAFRAGLTVGYAF